MKTLNLTFLSVLVAITTLSFTIPVSATIVRFELADHPDGAVEPPTYGLRLDELIDVTDNHDKFTFSFDSTHDASVSMFLDYDDNNSALDLTDDTIHIFGKAYGGWDTGTDWDATLQGLVDIDFTYTANIVEGLDGSGDDRLKVNPESSSNTGTIELLGWGGDLVSPLVDEDGGKGFSFKFSNFEDSKGNTSISGDPDIYAGWGWVNHSGDPHIAASDWLFIGTKVPEPMSLLLMGMGLLGIGFAGRRKL